MKIVVAQAFATADNTLVVIDTAGRIWTRPLSGTTWTRRGELPQIPAEDQEAAGIY